MKNKKVALLLAATMLVSAFTGFVNVSAAEEKVTIAVGEWPATEGDALNEINARKEAFEAANPDVVIEPDTWAYDAQTFYAKAQGGQLPTVFRVFLTEPKEIIETGYAANLTDVLKARGYEGKFNESLLEIVSDENGDIYAYPIFGYNIGLVVNIDMFEAAGLLEEDGTPMQPETWEEMAEFAVKIKEATGKPGFMMQSSGNSGGHLFQSIAWSYGVEFSEQDEDGNWIATFDTQEAVDALQFIKDLKWEYDVLPENTLIDVPTYREMYATGQAGMVLAPADIYKYCTQFGTDPEMIGMVPIPAGPEGKISLLGGSCYMVRSDATEEEIDAVIRWIETAYSYEATDVYKETSENNYIMNVENGQLVNMHTLSIWSDEAESEKFEAEMREKYQNANPNHVAPYNENGVSEVTLHPEVPVCAQGLYTILDACIQEVITNEDADCAEIIAKANADFQSDYLDNY